MIFRLAPINFLSTLYFFVVAAFQIDLKHINQTKENDNKVELGIDLREFYPSVEWDILGVPAERHEKYYPCCAEPYPGMYTTSYIYSIYRYISFALQRIECSFFLVRKEIVSLRNLYYVHVYVCIITDVLIRLIIIIKMT